MTVMASIMCYVIVQWFLNANNASKKVFCGGKMVQNGSSKYQIDVQWFDADDGFFRWKQ